MYWYEAYVYTICVTALSLSVVQACRGTVELTVRHVPRGHSTLSAPTPDHADASPAAAASYGQHYTEFSNSSSTRGDKNTIL